MTRSPLRLPVFSSFSCRGCILACGLSLSLFCLPIHAQVGADALPMMNAGLGGGVVAEMDFAQLYMDGTTKEQQKNEEMKEKRRQMVSSGIVSALDLDASGKAIDEYNKAATLMKQQKSQEAITHLQKAIAAYPKFVTAYNTLGLAYADQQDSRAKDEFEQAAKLDDKFPGSFVNLGMLALQGNDFATADSNLTRAAELKPDDARTLVALAFAENGNHEYEKTLATVAKVHALDHRQLANVHYIAANAALQLNDYAAMQRELQMFVSEDPTNALAPAAVKNLDILARRATASTTSTPAAQTTASQPKQVQTFPNSDRLKAELKGAGSETAPVEANPAESNTVASASTPAARPAPLVAPIMAGGLFTIRKAVDETALFFAVSRHGHMVDDLELTNIQVRDDNKPPAKILQFSPQSKLPMRIGLLIDTSGSVEERFGFEKHAAERFLEKVLHPDLDLGFVGGFSTETNVTQDFTADTKKLSEGIEKLTNGGGTSLFDAVSLACWKLGAYPENERVALVLVILSDGEDNSSHRSLKQAIAEAERAGVTIYTVSTAEKAAYTVSSPVDMSVRTDADRIMEVLAERSGGESMFPGDLQTLNKTLDKLGDLIRSRYLLVYRPADFQPNGKFRAIRVTAQQKGESLRVRVRKGYNARVEAAVPNGWLQEPHSNVADSEGDSRETIVSRP